MLGINKKIIGLSSFLLVYLLLGVIMILVPQQKAMAFPYTIDATLDWQDSGTIEYGVGSTSTTRRIVFTDSNPNDSNREFVANDPDGCAAEAKLVITNADNSRGELTYVGSDNATGECYGEPQVTEIVSLRFTDRASIDAGTGNSNFTNDPGSTVNDPDTQTETDSGNDCADAGFVLGWIICPIGSALAEITQAIDDAIYGLLYIDTDTWEESGVKAAWSNFRTISSTLIVLVLLVAVASQIFSFEFVSAYTIRKVLPKIFLAVIFIQLSWFLCVTAINISNTVGYSTQALISAPFESIADQYQDNAGQGAPSFDESNDGWISFAEVLTVYAYNDDDETRNGLIVAGGAGVGIYMGSLFSVSFLTSLGVGVAGVAAAGVGGAMLYVLALLIPALLAILVAFAVIILRVVSLIGLTMLVPLAIVAWVLPNTSKWWDRWWGMFFALLIFFPVVIAFITFGKVGALILATTASDETGVRNLFLLTGMIVAYFIPYFLIFKLLKFSGGALASLQNGINNVSNGIKNNGGIKDWRQKKTESGDFYKQEAARKKTGDATQELANLNGTKGLRNSWKKSRAKARQNTGLRMGGTSAYSGEIRQRQIDKSLDESSQEANGAVRRALRSLDAKDQTGFLQELMDTKYTDGIGKITIGGREYRVTEEMMAASIPLQADFKNNFDSILARVDKPETSGSLRSAINRVVADNGAVIDGLATDYSRLGTILESYADTDPDNPVVMNTARKKAREKFTPGSKEYASSMQALAENYDLGEDANGNKRKEGDFQKLDEASRQVEIDRKVNADAAGLLQTIRGKQAAKYSGNNSERRNRLHSAIETLSRGSKAEKEEAIGLAMQLTRQASELTGSDLTKIAKQTGLGEEFMTVVEGGGNQKLELQPNGSIIAVSTTGARTGGTPGGGAPPPPPAGGGGQQPPAGPTIWTPGNP